MLLLCGRAGSYILWEHRSGEGAM